MSIPKIIHQTFKSKELPLLTRWHISRMLKRNPEYVYEFYDDERIENFISNEFDAETLKAYLRLNIGAAKADFFRYAVLLKKGGIYLDIDGKSNSKFDSFINPDDDAIITKEGNPDLFAQWALIYAPGHPFLNKTMELMLDNIKTNRFSHDVHMMTGPTVYTTAIDFCLKNQPNLSYRILGVDYERHLQPKYKLGKFFLYKRGTHWKVQQKSTPVLK